MTPRRDEETAARTAWLLAIDVTERAQTGPGFMRVYNTPGKVGRGSDAKTALSRKIACYLACTVANCQPATLARAAKLNRKTVHSHLNDVEDMRDRPDMDRLLDDLREQMIRAACSLVMTSLGEAA